MDGNLSRPVLRLALIAAVLAATVVLTGLFSDQVRYACVGLIAFVALLSATERRQPGGGWWTLLAAGTGLSIAGAALAEISEGLGGLVAVVGGALVVIGATIGFPAPAEG